MLRSEGHSLLNVRYSYIWYRYPGIARSVLLCIQEHSPIINIHNKEHANSHLWIKSGLLTYNMGDL